MTVDLDLHPRSALRRDAGVFLAGQMVLLLAALLWMPFGVRDGAGVSNVLPALRPAPVETPSTAEHEQFETGEHRRAGRARPVAAVALLAAVALGLTGAAPSVRPPRRDVTLRRRAFAGPLGGRAPPLPR